MSETINLTVTSADTKITVSMIEQNPLSVNFYELALPDARTTQARIDAQAAATASAASATASANSATSSATSASLAAASFQAAQENSIINALIFG